jgi:hypothetical protein
MGSEHARMHGSDNTLNVPVKRKHSATFEATLVGTSMKVSLRRASSASSLSTPWDLVVPKPTPLPTVSLRDITVHSDESSTTEAPVEHRTREVGR